MKCSGCNSETGRMIGKIEAGKYIEYCPNCSNISEIPSRIDYASPLTKQKRQWQREKYAEDIVQPWEVKRGEVHKGYQPNKDFIKAYGHDADRLSIYTQDELKSTGMVSEKMAKKAKKGKFKDAKRSGSDFS